MTTSFSRPLKPETMDQVMSARGVLRSRTEMRPGGTLSRVKPRIWDPGAVISEKVTGGYGLDIA